MPQRRVSEALSNTTYMAIVVHSPVWGRIELCICFHVGNGIRVNSVGKEARLMNFSGGGMY